MIINASKAGECSKDKSGAKRTWNVIPNIQMLSVNKICIYTGKIHELNLIEVRWLWLQG
ncbi:MAG TPA: hypothetical protein VIY08_08525 [Candidatus Nitrosocosmicus sp.]